MKKPFYAVVLTTAVFGFIFSGCGCRDILAPSKLTVDEGIEAMKVGMTTGEYHREVRTTPILTRSNEFHWMMADGEIWTLFESKGAVDPVIIGFTFAKNDVLEQ